MADTVDTLAVRYHEQLVALQTDGPVGTAGLDDVVARATVLGAEGAWLVAAGHAGLAFVACAYGQTAQVLLHLDAAVAAGYNDCVALHSAPIRPLHQDPRFGALYQRMRVTEADLEELIWLHREMRLMAEDAQQAMVDNLGRLDTGVSLLPQVPLPTREPDTSGVLITRIDFAATQTALQRAAIKAEFQRSAGNTSLRLIDDSWDYTRARHDAWQVDELESRRLRAAAGRAFVARPGAGTALVPCPPLGSINFPG